MTRVRLESSSLCCWCFPCRSFSDSCFLSSPLCSELADVQWYGHDKAKPGTLVWDLPKWAQQSTVKPFFRLSAVSDSPLTTNNLIHKAPQNPALSRAAGWKRALWRPALHPSLHLQQRWTSVRSDFTETDLMNCCPAATQSLFFTHTQHTETRPWKRQKEKVESTQNHQV